jgi:hypothetical protein
MALRHCVLVLLAGCGSNSTSGATAASDAASVPMDASASEAAPESETAADAETAEAAADDASDAGPPCNTIANGAPVVDIVQVAADPPAPQGGTIVDGTYWATSFDIYTGPAGPAGKTGTSQTTALIQGSTVQLASAGQPMTRTVMLTTADAGFTAVDMCPDTQTSQGSYTATPSTLTILLPGGTDDAGARTVAETLTRQ